MCCRCRACCPPRKLAHRAVIVSICRLEMRCARIWRQRAQKPVDPLCQRSFPLLNAPTCMVEFHCLCSALSSFNSVILQPVSGVLSTQKARTPGCDSQHLYTGDALLTRLETARADACCFSSSDSSPCSIRLATILRLLCCSAVRGVNMWSAHIFARYPVLLQFRHSTSAETLQSLRVCTALPYLLHFPLKGASAFSFLGEGLFWRGFPALLRFDTWLGFFVKLKTLSPFCSSRLSDLRMNCQVMRMNCQVMPTPWRRSSLQNCGDWHPQMKIMAIICSGRVRPPSPGFCSNTEPLIRRVPGEA